MNPSTILRGYDTAIASLRATLAELEAQRAEAFDAAQEVAGKPLEVVAEVAIACGSTAAEVMGRSRHRGAVRARHAVCVALTNCGQGQSAIARLLGLDHSTVKHAVERGREHMEERGFRLAVERGVAVWRAEPELAPAPLQRLTFGHAVGCMCASCVAGGAEELAVGA